MVQSTCDTQCTASIVSTACWQYDAASYLFFWTVSDVIIVVASPCQAIKPRPKQTDESQNQ